MGKESEYTFLKDIKMAKRYIPLNAEFQRIVRREKAFLSDQCKEIKKNNKLGKTRDLFKKIREIMQIRNHRQLEEFMQRWTQ